MTRAIDLIRGQPSPASPAASALLAIWLQGSPALPLNAGCDHDPVMGMRTRAAVGLAVALGGSLYALMFAGGTVPSCLGPLGVTAVRCAAHTGLRPTEGAWGGMTIAAIALGILIAIARTRAGWSDAAAAIGGAGVGAIAYFARRPLAIEGPDYDGHWLVIPLPVSGWSLLFWTLGAALLGSRVLTVGRAIRDRLARPRALAPFGLRHREKH